MGKRYNLFSLIASAIISGFIQYFLYRYNGSEFLWHVLIFVVILSLLYVVASALSMKGFLLSLIFLPFFITFLYTEAIYSSYDTFSSLLMVILVMISMTITVGIFTLNSMTHDKPSKKISNAKNMKKEILEILRELEFLKIP